MSGLHNLDKNHVKLPFLDRDQELGRLQKALGARSASLVVLYGRRRLGKSRRLLEALRNRPAVYYVGANRDAALQREDLGRLIAGLLPGFDDVAYPDWSSLLGRWWRDAPSGAVLALDELPSLVRRSPELPSVLQKLVDGSSQRRHLVVCGSSQRMMHGLVLDGSAPLYGRAREILKVRPLEIGWLQRALRLRSSVVAVDHYAAWGGVPRYWELATEHETRAAAVRSLALDPLGVLYREPEQLLLDDLGEVSRASSILSLAGRGAHRVSEIAGRIGVPATSLSRPISLLTDLGLLKRESPWGQSPRDSKRSFYRIADPFLRLWFRFVEPERSRLEAGQLHQVVRSVEKRWPHHLGEAWEDLARQSVARLELCGHRWQPAARWWGPGTDRRPLEIDLLASSVDDQKTALCGEVKLSAGARDVTRSLEELRAKARRCPALAGKHVLCAIWVLHRRGSIGRDEVVSSKAVLDSSLEGEN